MILLCSTQLAACVAPQERDTSQPVDADRLLPADASLADGTAEVDGGLADCTAEVDGGLADGQADGHVDGQADSCDASGSDSDASVDDEPTFEVRGARAA